MKRRVWFGVFLVATVSLAGCASVAPPAAATATTSSANASGQWLGYHGDAARTGAVAADSGLDHLTKLWSTALAGDLHNQPVAEAGGIIVADESNHVTALDPKTGKAQWRVSLGTPLTRVSATAGCGNIDPLGITSTPVIDPHTNVVYVVGEVASRTRKVHHQLEGIDIATGKVVRSLDIDPPLPSGESRVHLLQRASLALANGRIYVSYGGNIGDCGDYHGWVVGVKETGAASKVSFEVASNGHGGAIWQAGGAPAVDSAGNLYVTTGNANPDPPQGGPDPKKYTESVVKLSPNLHPLASFKDRIAGGDEDLSTGNPVLLPNGNVFVVGKTDVAYVLTQKNLSHVASIPGICGSDPDGGPTFDAALAEMFVPCKGGGIQRVYLGTAGGAKTGHARAGSRLTGANSAPVLVGQRLWALQYPTGTLTEYAAKSGKKLQTVRVGSTVANFATPSVAFGLLLVGTDDGVTAFS